MKTKWSSEQMVDGIGRIGPRPHYHYLARALQPQNTVLEVGCGPCHLYRYLTAAGIKADFSGCDLTSEMLAKGRETFPDMKLFECDVQNMSNVADNSYDWVVCSDVIIHVERPFDGLAHLWRCTRGALLLVIRESTFPEDLVDIQRAYQTLDGVRYHYNVLNLERTVRRLRELVPAPQAIDIQRTEAIGWETVGGRVLPFLPATHPLWSSSYVLLKDRSKVNWLGEGEHVFSKTSWLNRLARKARYVTNLRNRWDDR